MTVIGKRGNQVNLFDFGLAKRCCVTTSSLYVNNLGVKQARCDYLEFFDVRGPTMAGSQSCYQEAEIP